MPYKSPTGKTFDQVVGDGRKMTLEFNPSVADWVVVRTMLAGQQGRRRNVRRGSYNLLEDRWARSSGHTLTTEEMHAGRVMARSHFLSAQQSALS